ncbi:aminoacyl-tRNA hydrolase [Melissococcus plutonius]|uniref:Peptidyl-tRNA hydrolase n=1 Tax=Melissococcus plutonius TaxID=33970 RepID=A0A2Z5Y0M4_9ENTE|nr:aminoacyl-tRNA hydrolase [Melissococcus plutonius]BAL61549.1 peptidyl-tRNA hydrolase [Melissococcus plutonius DAT561]MCV2499282.1 aminoacyl-tRNA hydrolase [Melissococcus plutonius]MCV2501186.1 aminoacyl-tRNA hydrolase [Melissococcus plutonius]MCV2505456.1 aminoacyl-tRNA hydrolase [Melissococcus plutonius]MCV2507816.1 aminoacyl-tRNA hydrolase [Melissococcus plutonius]
MKMIVGLGNPGTKYQATKHNIGFITLDEIATRYKVDFNKNQFEAVTTDFFIDSEKIMLIKPLTYMNESGRSIGPLVDYYGLNLSDLIIIYDDLDLPVGKVRVRAKGSAGGHNGIKSLIAHLGTNDFTRIKVGISRPENNDTVIHHVLSAFKKEQHIEIQKAIKTAADAAIYMCSSHTVIDAMNQFNGK